jgi:uncharacterized membrane protein
MHAERIEEVDVLRGVAIVLMVIYHLFFDLHFLGMASIDLYDLPWVLFQRVVGTLFLLVVGISLVLSEKKKGHHAKRAAKLGAVALLITVATWVYPHTGFIRFGIIHMIALSTLIAPFFLRFGRLNIVIGLLVIAAGIEIHYTDIDYLFWLGLIRPDYMAFDHYPMVPWFGIVLIGMELGKRIEEWKGYVPVSSILSLLGRNSLLIYLIHQPLLIAMFLLLL